MPPTTSQSTVINAASEEATTTTTTADPPSLPQVDLDDLPLSSIASYASSVSKSLVLRFIGSSVTYGQLQLLEEDGTQHAFGSPFPAKLAKQYAIYKLDEPVVVRIVSPYFYFRCLTRGSLGFAESFILNELDLDSGVELSRLLVLLAANRVHASFDERELGLVARAAEFGAACMHQLFRRNTLTGAKRNIQAHYDLSNDMFATFLGETWVYSCAVYEKETDTLDQAQTQKLLRLITKLNIQPDDHVLEIGFGWGEASILMAKTYGCKVTGITLSEEQLKLAEPRAADQGVGDLIDFQLCDYRSLQGTYDKILSIEMMEALGHDYLGTFYKACDRLLKPDGLLAVQVITMPDSRYDVYRRTADFINTYIFPGGCCPSPGALSDACRANSSFELEAAENIGVHYASTLAQWQHRFLHNHAQLKKLGFDEVFMRKWAYYFSYCEAGFATRMLNTHQLLYSRVGNTHALPPQHDVPLTPPQS
eukprot:TRINITY_DN12558_c10_g1_i1.p1 TRINITY_DN12558_c10_g1~~TRINITY_DN12558_c10_g1_i1.p1  ORF type:complete len:479 (+),score=148.76 TRINITY_DN12558_c10_g1_i1:79-1515(+)